MNEPAVSCFPPQIHHEWGSICNGGEEVRENKYTSFVLVHPYSICTVLIYRTIDLLKKVPLLSASKCKMHKNDTHWVLEKRRPCWFVFLPSVFLFLWKLPCTKVLFLFFLWRLKKRQLEKQNDGWLFLCLCVCKMPWSSCCSFLFVSPMTQAAAVFGEQLKANALNLKKDCSRLFIRPFQL